MIINFGIALSTDVMNHDRLVQSIEMKQRDGTFRRNFRSFVCTCNDSTRFFCVIFHERANKVETAIAELMIAHVK